MNKQTAALLEQHFDTAFAAPKGIARLRELILTLAMQGKLVPQDANDPPASQLLKEIAAEKKRLVKEGKINAPKPMLEVRQEEIPHPLPHGWTWVHIRDICHDWGQKTPDSRFTYIDVGSINNKAGVIGQEVQVLESHEAPSRARKIVQRGTVIYSTVRPYLLNIAIIEDEYDNEPIASTAFAILHPFAGVNNRFIYCYLRSPAFIKYVEGAMKGVAYPAINDGDFFQGVFPLSPLPEQQRIVAKIDQLMARCDELERLRAEREQKRSGMHTAALKRLLDAQGADSIADAWQFISQHFGDFYAVKENVAELRKAVLQLAVIGKLAPQNPNDPPASQLLKEIDAEKMRLVKEGKIKAPKPLPEIQPAEIPYALPQGWEWATLGQISLKVSDGFHHTPKKISAGIKYISATHIYNGRIDWDSNLFVSEKEYLDLDKKVAQGFGDILIVNRGAGCGDAAIVDSNEQFCFQNAAIVGFSQKLLCGKYLLKYLHSSRDQFLEKFIQGGVQPMLSNRLLATHLIAIPPLLEQHRIVVKIDQLMMLCDTLEQQIDAATSKQAELLDAVMAQV